jgi:hypothetical protein
MPKRQCFDGFTSPLVTAYITSSDIDSIKQFVLSLGSEDTDPVYRTLTNLASISGTLASPFAMSLACNGYGRHSQLSFIANTSEHNIFVASSTKN